MKKKNRLNSLKSLSKKYVDFKYNKEKFKLRIPTTEDFLMVQEPIIEKKYFGLKTTKRDPTPSEMAIRFMEILSCCIHENDGTRIINPPLPLLTAAMKKINGLL